jgi:beta-N-acetylhexosaminidase
VTVTVGATVAAALALASGGDGLSDGQLAGQRVVFAYQGAQPPRALLRRVEAGRAAGVILFAHNVRSRAAVRAAVARLQRAARRSPVRAPLLVMVDQEGGPVRRLPGGPSRSAAAVGATGSAAAARRDGRVAGAALRAAGANVNLAPVLDVCRAGAAIERERRCYGRDPGRVARLGGAFAAGLRDRGVLPAPKHFPGFGAAPVNTDLAPQTLRVPLRRLRSLDERPFAALARSVPLVMLSNAIYPALDRRRPAGLSAAIATRELRGRLDFRGVSLTDSLDAAAPARLGSPQRRALLAAAAGTDLLLFSSYRSADRAARALGAALRSGRLSRRSFRASVDRALRLRARARPGGAR